MPLTVAARTHVGCKRKVNEDSILDRADLGLWVVADGMGGHKAGDVASALIVEALGAAPLSGDLAERVEEIRNRLLDANRRLIELRPDADATIGSTVVVLTVAGSAFACLWAGDSRIYRLRDGDLKQLTRDHSLVQDLVELGEIRPEDARGHPNANVVTRAVGASKPLEIDQVVGEVHPGDVFLLASDGLTRVIEDAALKTALAGADPAAVADRLLEACLAGGAPDNVSLIILRSS